MPHPTHEFTVDTLCVEIYPTRAEMGAAAGARAVRVLQETLARQPEARLILASADSQREVVAALANADVDWPRVTIFHMDEYVGIGPEDPVSFRRWQQQHLLRHVPGATFHGMRGEAPNLPAECTRYGDLLAAAPIDLVCLGIGENGHLAFNDPHVADFDDPHLVKQMEPDPACRQQQVNEGAFAVVDEMPRQGLTLTIPALMSGRELVCTVPGARKAAAVRDTLRAEISPSCPATILRRHPRCTVFLDAASAGSLGGGSRL
jgi:glucosamine-6-phosphate deaminase